MRSLLSPERSQGPNQRAVLSELVTLVQTSSIGARKVRLRTRSLPRRRPVGFFGVILSSSSWFWFVARFRWPARGLPAAAERDALRFRAHRGGGSKRSVRGAARGTLRAVRGRRGRARTHARGRSRCHARGPPRGAPEGAG